MNRYTLHFSNGETADFRTRMSLTELIIVLNDNRKFIAVEGDNGETIILHKGKVVFITTKEYC